MNPTLLLRIASVLAMLHSILHTIGGVFGKPAPGAQAGTWAIMQASQFLTMGVNRTYTDFYVGFGLFVTVALAVESVVFWQLGSLAKTHAAVIKPLLASFAVAYLCYATVATTYFFAAPAIFEGVIALLLLAASAKSK